jgi:hypothetical protein
VTERQTWAVVAVATAVLAIGALLWVRAALRPALEAPSDWSPVTVTVTVTP